MEIVETIEEWNDLAKTLKEFDYSLVQMQYGIEYPVCGFPYPAPIPGLKKCLRRSWNIGLIGSNRRGLPAFNALPLIPAQIDICELFPAYRASLAMPYGFPRFQQFADTGVKQKTIWTVHPASPTPTDRAFLWPARARLR